MVRRRAPLVFVTPVLAVLAAIACRSDDDCICTIDVNGDQRTLACGRSVCVSGTLQTCADKDQIVTRADCSSLPMPTAPIDAGGPIQPSDPTCDDLDSFCTTNCNNPPSLAADCHSTAASQDASRCSSWRLTNAFSCKP
jgi:hypothetical protein